MQVTQTATLIDPDNRSCVSAKWLWLQLYCISPLGACCWQAAGSSSSVCRSFVFGLWRSQRIGQADLLCASCGKDGIFLFLFRPPIRNCCHNTSDSLLDFRLKNSSDRKHKSDTGQLNCVGSIRITDNRHSITELQDGCFKQHRTKLSLYELIWATERVSVSWHQLKYWRHVEKGGYSSTHS